MYVYMRLGTPFAANVRGPRGAERARVQDFRACVGAKSRKRGSRKDRGGERGGSRGVQQAGDREREDLACVSRVVRGISFSSRFARGTDKRG